MRRDLERARAWAGRWLDPAMLGDASDATVDLVAELAAVRADERAAIVAWLRRTALTLGDASGFQVLATASNDVEHGAHQAPRS